MIEVSHLSKKYGTHPAIEDLSFTVGDGQIFGLLGPNGAGKSTIMNILTGYLAPTSGEVKVAGFSLPEQAQQAKACVGYLPEQPPLYPEMTVQEYLDFAAELKGIKKKADRKEQVRKAARRTGLEEVLPRLIRSLSKGYRQRVGIAQALLGAPQLIILDEPTVGLDPAQVIEIRRLIRELGKSHTVILSSHILSEVQAVCSQVLILSKGHLVAVGAPEQLAEKLNPGSRLRATALGGGQTVLKAVGSIPGIRKVEIESEADGQVTFTAESADASDDTKKADNTDANASDENKESEKNTVYYVTDVVQQGQYIKLFKEQGMNAVILDHNIDTSFITQLEQRNDHYKFMRIDADLTESLKDESGADLTEATTTLSEVFKKALNNDKLTVKVENLKNADVASVLTLSEQGRRMQDMMKMYAAGGMGGMDPSMFAADQTLTLNANNELVKYILDNKDSEHVPMFAEQLYDLAMLSNQPLSVDQMTKFVKRSNDIMLLLTK